MTDPVEDQSEIIKIHHPDLPGETGESTRAALEEVWSEKGWEEGEADKPLPPAEGDELIVVDEVPVTPPPDPTTTPQTEES